MFNVLSKLMPHQIPAVAKVLLPRVGGLYMDMGLGKTRVTIELARLRYGKYDHIVWFCPVSLKDTIRYQWLIHTDLHPDQLYVFDDKTTPETLPRDRLVYIIGIESMSASERIILTYHGLVTLKSFVVVDESQYIKGHDSNRTLRITHMSIQCRYRMVLTGTPFTQGVVDLYSQMYFLSPEILGYRSFWSFERNHLEYEELNVSGRRIRTGRIIQAHNVDYLAAKIAPYVYQVKKEECLDLPEKIYKTYYCSMTKEQQYYYHTEKMNLLERYKDLDDFNPILIFHLFTVLQTISCGFLRRKDPATGETERIDIPHERLDLLCYVIDQIRRRENEQEKIIIWTKYRICAEHILTRLQHEYGPQSAIPYHGDVAQKDRPAHLNRWKTDPETCFLVATQSTGGEGLTLNESAYSIYYADEFKYSKRIQSEDRNHRIGQIRKPTYITLMNDSKIDERISDALECKGNALDAFQKCVNQYRKDGIKQNVLNFIQAL